MKSIEKWPQLVATVHSAEPHLTVGRRGGKRIEYNLKFSFVVAGRTYEHTKIVRSSYWSTIQEGSQIYVAYNAADPEIAVLVKEPGGFLAMVWTVALFVAAVWLSQFISWVRRRLRKG